MKSFLKLFILVILIYSCEEEFDPFLISSNAVGVLTDSTEVKDLESLFINDAIATYIGGDEFTGNINDIEIYEKGGNMLLVLTPFEALDSTSTIKTIRVIDPRYKTLKGINNTSTFKELNDNYVISGIQNTIKNLIISVDAINVYFTMDKSELPTNMRFDMNMKVDPIQIPDQAQLKDFYIQWY